jgi:hypothetical protein
MTSPTVFISYSHKDEVWKDRLVTHLGVLQQESILDLWDDRRIGAGGNWYQKIQEAIAKAKVAVILVSADFLTSNFILSEEVPHLLERRDKEGLRIFPVIIRPCAWKRVKWLARMNLRPKGDKSISSGAEHQIDADLAAIAEEVAAIIESKNPITPLKTSSIAPEKISIPQLQSTNSTLSGHEMSPRTMSKITILHLSDIHFKKDKDDENKAYRKDVKNKMVAQIKAHIDNNNLDLDFVAVTGDIAFSGKEYNEAKSFFKELKSVLPEKTIFLVVPGNHDVYRAKVSNFFSLHDIVKKQQTDAFLQNEAERKSIINVKFEPFRRFVEELNPDLYRQEDDYFWVRNFEDQNVSFLGLNSCWASENDNDRNNGNVLT